MKFFKNSAPFIFSLGIISSSFASTSFAQENNNLLNKTYLSFELGASFSNDANMRVPEGVENAPPSGGYWDPAPEGYASRVGESEIYGLGVGYHINPLVSAEITYSDRTSFSYSQFQSPQPSGIGPRVRYFDLENQNIMLNGVLHLDGFSDNLKYTKGDFSIAPYIDGGVGIARNTVTNFHSVALTGYNFSTQEGKSKTKISPAFQIGLGVATKIDAFWEVKLGYRYYDGGDFESKGYILDNPDGLPTSNGGVLVPVWKGEIRTNEVYGKLVYNF